MDKQHFDEKYGSKPPQNYERFFVPTIGEPVARDLIRKADLKPGERVLDVACGTGIIARLALKQVEDNGTVTGLDINPGMLAVARSITQDSAIEWYEASAEAIPFPGEKFDVIFCQMGLQFMEDKVRALQEMRRVLVPNGRIILNVPGVAGPIFSIFAEAMEKNISSEAAGFVKEVFSLNDVAELQDLMNNADFRDVEIGEKNTLLSLPAPKEFLWQYVHSTPLVGLLSTVDEETRTAFEHEVVVKWQNFVDDGAFIYEQCIITVKGRK